MSIEIDSHPVGFVKTVRTVYGDDLVLSFSRYFYRPQSILDERVLFEVPIKSIDGAWLQDELARLPVGWDLALNSKIQDARGRTKHIGMIDFVGQHEIDHLAKASRKALGASIVSRTSYYDSGRSIHGYVLDLISPSQWYRFLGRLLLINEPGDAPLIDTRWVGHRLLGGYSALRWSANSEHYLAMPSLVARSAGIGFR